jgi:hypothetical protein
VRPDHESKVERICHLALERDSDARVEFVAEACAGDDGLRLEVDRLLAQTSAAEQFIEAPALEVAARCVAGGRAAITVGERIGSYEIVGWLGAGGMGEVYRGRDPYLNRDVAIKVLPLHLSRIPSDSPGSSAKRAC